MSSRESLESVLIAADPAQGQAVCEALRAAGIEACAIFSDDGTTLEIFVPAESAPHALQIIREGNWPRLA